MRILITGGYGFVGTQLLRLIPDKHHITVFDNLMGYAGEMPKSIPNNHTFVFGDVRDGLLTGEIVRAHDVIVHLAGIVGYPACRVHPQIAYEVNVIGTQNVVKATTRSQKLVFVSSSSVYGHQTMDVVDETCPPRPLTEYGVHKEEGELSVRSAAARWIILRPATAFGASDRLRLDVLPNTMLYDALVKKEMQVFEGHVVRPFIHVLDFARALLYCVEGNVAWDSVYNIGNPDLTMRKINLIHKIAHLTGASIIDRDGSDPDQRNYWLDMSKFDNTGFTYLPHTLELGYEQLSRLLPEFENKYEEFSSPYQFKRYLEKENVRV